jgi:hypothetical protein
VVPVLRESDPHMKVHSKVAMAVAAGAMVLASAAPASARGYDGRWGRYSHHYRDRDNSGAVIGAILGIGLIAAIASSASKQREAERRYPDPRQSDRPYDPRYDNRDYDGRDYGADGDRYGSSSDGAGYYGAADENTAADACALAARDEASRMGGYAEVRDITAVRPFGNGWDVTGVVSQRASYSAPDGRERSFRCIWENGRVNGVSFS